MKPSIAGIFCVATAVGGGWTLSNAAVIASCGPMEGYSLNRAEFTGGSNS